MKTQIRKNPQSGVAMHGFYRVSIVNKRGKVKGDSGWHHNLITSSGLTNFLTQTFLRAAGSSAVSMAHLGSALSNLASSASSLVGEMAKSLMITLATASTSRAASTDGDTARFLGTFASNFAGASTTIACLGLYMTTTGSIFCGGSFASSTLATNQAVLITYDVVFVASTS